MNCPACQKEMIAEDFGGVIVDFCKDGCKGIWFDWRELNKLDEQNEGLGQALKQALNCERINDENRPPLKCPKCQLPMHVHKYESEKEVNVDECYKCGGFFLDSGELKVIRDNFMSEGERDAYMQKILKDVPGYQEEKQDLEKDKQRTEAIRRFTRFLRVSYYLSGK